MNQQDTAQLNLTREEANLLDVILNMALYHHRSDLAGYLDDVKLLSNKVERVWLEKDQAELNKQYFAE